MNVILKMFILLMVSSTVFAQPTNTSLQATAVPIPGGKDGIGFDDLNFSPSLHKLLVPAGHTGRLYMIDPDTYAMTSIDGFSSSPQFKKGHDEGISSADEGQGFIFVPDHGTHQLNAVDAKTGAIVSTAPLAEDVDLVRYVDATHEVWVTEPDGKERKLIGVFTFTTGDKPKLSHTLDIPSAEEPESLTIDQSHQRAYTNYGKQVGVIDINTHQIIAQWPNECEKAHGTAVDEKRGFLFVGCAEGKVEVFDLNQKGKQVGSLITGPGIDLIDYNPRLSHLYVTGSKNATLSVLGVSSHGELSLLGVGQAAMRSHCVAGDDKDNIWVCDPHHGQLLRYKDTFLAVK